MISTIQKVRIIRQVRLGHYLSAKARRRGVIKRENQVVKMWDEAIKTENRRFLQQLPVVEVVLLQFLLPGFNVLISSGGSQDTVTVDQSTPVKSTC